MDFSKLPVDDIELWRRVEAAQSELGISTTVSGRVDTIFISSKFAGCLRVGQLQSVCIQLSQLSEHLGSRMHQRAEDRQRSRSAFVVLRYRRLAPPGLWKQKKS